MSEPTADATRDDATDAPVTGAGDGPAEAPRDAERDSTPDIRAVLAEIGAEEAVARLDARIAGLEGDLVRAGNRVREGDRARRGEIDLMRARIEDALGLVHEHMEEQRTTWSQFEERFSTLVADAEEHNRSFVSELRDELTPRVQRVVLRTDEVSAELKGEIGSVAADLEQRAAAIGESIGALRGELDRLATEVPARFEREAADRAGALAALEAELVRRVEETDAAARARHDEAATTGRGPAS